MPIQFLDIFILLIVMLNPLLMSVYLIDIIKGVSFIRFSQIIFRAFLISCSIFIIFSMSGDFLFRHVLQIEFGSFLIFGGVLFAIISIQQMLQGPESIMNLRGSIERIGGAATLPFMLGPGTISTSIYAGSVLTQKWAMIAIVGAVIVAAISLILLKVLFDRISLRYAEFTESYVDIIGRIIALLMGSIAVNMIVRGVRSVFF